MKTILVPTDFSTPAYNAAFYALQVAKQLRASLHLLHVMEVLDKTLLDTQLVWPIIDYNTLKENTVKSIKFVKQKLEEETNVLPENVRTPITYSIREGVVHKEITKEIQEKKILLLVAGMYGANKVNRFLFGSKSRDFIDHVNCPILLIPSEGKYRKIKKIAFATDLSPGDIELIELLAVFAKLFDAEILIAHISADVYDTQHQQEIEAFLNEVTCKNNYDKIYYRHVQNKNIEEGILWLSENGQVDMLTMVHRAHNMFSKLLDDSKTKQLAKRIKVPLMVLKP
ncbi:MAG TPA: universal stress protein [Pseudosphingobacterium sp.]|nr:universal stress protein [Pseudosphingobacterium sp.]